MSCTIGSPEVAGYAVALAAEIGHAELGEQHRAGGVPAGTATGRATRASKTRGRPGGCWTPASAWACTGALRAAGADPGELARRVRAALDAAYQRDGFARRPRRGPIRRQHGGDQTGGRRRRVVVVPAPAVIGPAMAGPGDPAGALAVVRAATAEPFLAPGARRRAGCRAGEGRVRALRIRTSGKPGRARMTGACCRPGRRRRYCSVPGPGGGVRRTGWQRAAGAAPAGRRIAATLRPSPRWGRTPASWPGRPGRCSRRGRRTCGFIRAGGASTAGPHPPCAR